VRRDHFSLGVAAEGEQERDVLRVVAEVLQEQFQVADADRALPEFHAADLRRRAVQLQCRFRRSPASELPHAA
jgi:hypothetical protein